MWRDVALGFQIAFRQAWEAYEVNNIPIGAAVLNAQGYVVAQGRNQCQAPGPGLISRHQLAHAEANAILQLSEMDERNHHPDIRTYTLYTTMEPCPFCFGAIVMGSIRFVKFAARDGWAGATAINDMHPYVMRKGIVVEGPFAEMERVQIAMQLCYETEQRPHGADILAAEWEQACPGGVTWERRLAAEGILARLAREGVTMDVVYDFIVEMGAG